jgi:uncharacterized protein with HEPN domain
LSFRDCEAHFRDILESIDHIDIFMEGIDFDSYRADAKTKSAVERQMQIITEAAYRLGVEAETLCPGPDWKGLRGMENTLRHAYHRVDDKIVWDTVNDDLPSLKASILEMLGRRREA